MINFIINIIIIKKKNTNNYNIIKKVYKLKQRI